jgi:hypothetical protein
VIAASGILVVIAFVTLILGVFRTGLGLIWTSIAASILAAIFLALGVVQGNRRRVAPAGGTATATGPSWADTSTQGPAVYQRGSLAEEEEVEEEEEEVEEEAEPEPAPPPLTVVAEPESPFRAPPAEEKEPAARRGAAASATVVVIPDRDKFHKETCRYAKHAAAMMMSKASAKRQGYKPCGVCKP